MPHPIRLFSGLLTVTLAVLSTQYSVLHAQPPANSKPKTNPAPAKKPDANRLAYLGGPLDPYYPHRDFPKLITPQWVGEDGVECVVTLAIDDMRDSAKYEAYLRPILDRLKQIDGRTPVSIMSCRADPADPQLQKWLTEGLSIEVHTYDHPCPLLQDGGLTKAKETYDKCVDLMNQIPSNKPVAFRMPCCDSKNTPSPRFWAEIFNKTTEKGNFLQIDSSVFNIITNKDQELPKEITELPGGEERFRRYVPFANFVNTIEDYPYPYIIGGLCWEFPCVTPSDWSAQFVQKPNNPDTVRDWKLALDACVLKQGTFNLVFHPHGWIKPEQIVELIDHAVTKHGKKVKFLTFRECAERLNKNLFQVKHLRELANPQWLMRDDNQDGYMDVVLLGVTQQWMPDKRKWGAWGSDPFFPEPYAKVELDRPWIPEGLKASESSRTLDLILRELTGRNERGKDIGLRLVDIDGDGKRDALFSNHERDSLVLFKGNKAEPVTVFDVVRGKEDTKDGNKVPVIPPFVRADGTNNGAWFHSSALWLMNEDTWRLPDNVFKLTFADMLKGSGSAVQGSAKAEGLESKDGGRKPDCCGQPAASDDK